MSTLKSVTKNVSVGVFGGTVGTTVVMNVADEYRSRLREMGRGQVELKV